MLVMWWETVRPGVLGGLAVLGALAAVVLVAGWVMSLVERRRRRLERERDPLTALIGDALCSGKVDSEFFGWIPRRVRQAADQRAEIAKIRAELGLD